MRPTTEEIRIAQDLVDMLIGWGMNVYKAAAHGNYRVNIEQIYMSFGEDWSYNWGATKAVLYFPKKLENWVIKFNGSFENEYSELEAENYTKAEENGLNKFFTPTFYAFQRGDLKFFLQKKVQPDEDEISRTFTDYVLDNGWIDEDCNDEGVLEEAVSDIDWEDKLYILFGYSSEVEDLIRFIDRVMEQNDVNPDIHSGNIGIDTDGNYVIFDFSGY